MLFTMAELERAAGLVYARMSPTPQYAWPLLAERLGAEVWVKHENHTATGAFKLRGGITMLDHLASQGCKGIATATRGNHGQSIPYAAAPHGIPVQVWAPEGNSVEKNAAMKAWGAELHVFGSDFEEARLESLRVAEAEGLFQVPPFHPVICQGVGTYALELFRAAPDIDTVYVPVGMGSGACSVITVRDLLGLKTNVVAVVMENADAYARSMEAGRLVETETCDTFADGLACRAPMQAPLDILLEGAARIVRVSEDDVAEAMRVYYADTHNVAEGAGAAALAALMRERAAMAGKRVAVILGGGNVDAGKFREVLGGGTPAP